MSDILASLVIAFSFFTIIPMPTIDWTPGRMKHVPMMMPIIGLVLGLMTYALFSILQVLDITPILKGVLLCLTYLIYTGALHVDGYIDTADAYFSRRSIEEKLIIMKDSNVGAFGATALVFYAITKTAVLSEICVRGSINVNKYGILLIFIPIISRLLQSSMIYLFKPAKQNGLSRMFGELDSRVTIIHFLILVIIAISLFVIIGAKALILPSAAMLYYILFYFSSKKHFGGITGDLMGAFLEVSELIMLMSLIFI